jgi:hypothetical protein
MDWQFSLKWEDFPLSEIPLVDTKILVLDGRANISFLFYQTESSDEVLLKAEGNMQEGRIYLKQWDEEISRINGTFTIKDKKLNIDSLRGELHAAPFEARAQMELVPPYPFSASLNAKGVLLEEISPFFPFLKDYNAFKLPAEAQLDAKGSLADSPFEITAFFQEAALYSLLMKNVEMSFIWYDNQLILKNFYANLDEGKISGEGEIILNRK